MPPKLAAKPAAGAAKKTTTTSKIASKSSTTKPTKPTTTKASTVKNAKPKGTVSKTGKTTSPTKKKQPSGEKEKKKWTAEDSAAQKIQALGRGFLQRKRDEKTREEKRKYDEEMQRLELEAYRAHAEYERREAEKQRKKQEEARKKAKEEAKMKRDLLEAAFDDENDTVKKLLAKGARVEEPDENGNTPLSEAAAGGACAVIKTLVAAGANPNAIGQFGRTPIFRASFGGHIEAIQTLLEVGGDPRIHNDEGELPETVTNNPEIKAVFAAWDVSKTDALVATRDAERARKREQVLQKRATKQEQLQKAVQFAEEEYGMRQKQLLKAHQELNKRIHEHDTVLVEGKTKLGEVTLQQVKDAEIAVADAKEAAAAAQEKLSAAKMALHEENKEARKEMGEAVDDDSGESELPGIPIDIKRIEEFLTDEKRKQWLLIIDISDRTSLYLRYRDCNYLNTCNPRDMLPDTIRLAILGALRFGKPVVFDMMEVNMFNELPEMMNAVEPGLYAKVMDRSLLENRSFASLIRKTDGDQYDALAFTAANLAKFCFVILTKNRFPPPDVLQFFNAVRIKAENAF